MKFDFARFDSVKDEAVTKLRRSLTVAFERIGARDLLNTYDQFY